MLKFIGGLFAIASVVLLAFGSYEVITSKESWSQIDFLMLAMTAGFIAVVLTSGQKNE
jgi:hypothetical protein